MSAQKKQKGQAGQSVEGAAPSVAGGDKRKQAAKPAAAPAAAAAAPGQGKNAGKKAKQAAKKAAAAGGAAPAKVAVAAPKKEQKAAAPVAGGKKGKKAAPAPVAAVEKDEASDDDDGVAEAELKAIDDAQKELEKHYEAQGKEVDLIEQKYGKLRRPAQKARDLLARKVKGFWAQAISNHNLIGAVIDGAADEAILGSLIALDVEENEDYKTGMRIIMEFGPNEYFSTTKVTRQYAVPGDGGEAKVTISPKVKWTKPGFVEDEANKTSFFLNWLNDTEEPHAEIAEVLRDEIYRDPLGAINGNDQEFPEPESGDDSDDGEGLAALLGGDDEDDE